MEDSDPHSKQGKQQKPNRDKKKQNEEKSRKNSGVQTLEVKQNELQANNCSPSPTSTTQPEHINDSLSPRDENQFHDENNKVLLRKNSSVGKKLGASLVRSAALDLSSFKLKKDNSSSNPNSPSSLSSPTSSIITVPSLAIPPNINNLTSDQRHHQSPDLQNEVMVIPTQSSARSKYRNQVINFDDFSFKSQVYNRIVRISANYHAKDETEVSLKIGDEVKLRGVPEFGWCEGELNDGSGLVGWFPVHVSEELISIIDQSVQEISAIDTSSIISLKDRNSIMLSKCLVARPDPSHLQDKHIIITTTTQTNNSDKLNVLQLEIEKKKKAEYLNNHLNGRSSVHRSDSDALPKSFSYDANSDNCLTDSAMIYDSDDDDDELTMKDDSIEEQAIALFTSKPKKAIDLLIENKIVQNEAKAVADYLFHSNKIDKSAMGDYLSEKNDFNAKVLNHFLNNLQFKGLEFDQSLRKFLLTFKLPGEAQKIDRLMEGFARRYYSQYGGSLFANQDTAYILSFSLIMLNTDLHNPSIKKKMTAEEFIKNQRGINGGNDLPRVFLEDLYQRISEEKIQMEDVLYPNAMKRGYLLREKHAKKYQKLWCILDPPSFSLYLFKHETDTQAFQTYDIRNVAIDRKQFKLEKKKQKIFPISLTCGDHEKIKLFATSQRIWVDWLSCFNECIGQCLSAKNEATLEKRSNLLHTTSAHELDDKSSKKPKNQTLIFNQKKKIKT